MKKINENKCNLSLLLLLPLISKETERWENYLSEDFDAFINGYSRDKNKPFMDRHIFLEFDWNKLNRTKIKYIIDNENYQNSYTYTFAPEVASCIYALKIPDKYKIEYDLIMSGNYTSVTNKTKILILSFWGLGTESNLFTELYNASIQGADITIEELPEELDLYDEIWNRGKLFEEVVQIDNPE